MNVLFLELSKVINTNIDNIFTNSTINGKLYNFNEEFISNINKLITEFDFYVVLTNNCQKSLSFDDILFHLKSIGLEANRILGSLHTDDNESKMNKIQNWYQKQKASITNYLVLDNFENIQPSPIENIYLVINGFNNSEYDKCSKRFKTIVKNNLELNKQTEVVQTNSENLDSFSAELVEAKNTLMLQERTVDQQTKEALYLLDQHISYFSYETKDKGVFEAHDKVLKDLTKKFPKADTQKLITALNVKMFLTPSVVFKFVTIPVALIALASFIILTAMPIWLSVISAVGVLMLVDILTFIFLQNGIIKPHLSHKK